MHQPAQLHNIPLYIISTFFIAMGLMVLIRKKPLIFNARWFLAFMVLIFVLITIDVFLLRGSVSYFPSLMFIVLIAYMSYIMKGYMVIGADGDDFQKAFISVLTEGNYKFEQTFASIKIAEPSLDISIAFQSWVGAGQIRMRNKENKETFRNIISQLKTKVIRTNLIVPILYIIIGALLLFTELGLWRD